MRHPIHKVVKKLKERFPPAFPVHVRLVNLKNDLGTVILKDDKFIIQLDKNLEWTQMCEVLAHEAAHMLVWSYLDDANPENHGHNEAWGVWYAKLYSFIFWEMGD